MKLIFGKKRKLCFRLIVGSLGDPVETTQPNYGIKPAINLLYHHTRIQSKKEAYCS